MSFSEILERSLREKSPLLRLFEMAIAPAGDREIQALAARAAALTRQHFGRTMRLFAPIYLSNECINSCAYCGFSRENAIQRVTLEVDQVEAEARHLTAEGFRNILLVAGEHPKFVTGEYLVECVGRLRGFVPGISIEVAPMEAEAYRPIVDAGAEGLVIYQETYHLPTYERMHVHGPKKDFGWRLDCAERGHEAGFRRIGVGALLGLWDWREEALALAAHLEYLQRACWRSLITVSLPRLRPAAGEFQPPHPVSERDFIQLLCALRVTFPMAGIVLSTREAPGLRDVVAPLGVTMMSAGSHTEPGGYTGQGRASLHLTVRGKPLGAPGAESATEQFAVSDDRTAGEVQAALEKLGLEPVWKDWDAGIAGAA